MTEECTCCTCGGPVVLAIFITYFLSGLYYAVLHSYSLTKLEQSIKILKKKVDDIGEHMHIRTLVTLQTASDSAAPPPRYEEVIER
jgi:hypothetical protein